MIERYLGYPPSHIKKWLKENHKQSSEDVNGTPVFTYSVNVTNGQLELDFGPDMAGKEIGLDIEEN